MQKIINIYNTINLDCKKSFFILILILVIRNENKIKKGSFILKL